MNATTLSGFPLLSQAQERVKQGRYEEASRFLIGHLRQHHEEPRGLALLGEVAMHLGALVQADQCLRRALARGLQGDRQVRRTLASVMNQQQRLAEAEAMFRALIAEDADPDTLTVLAILLEKMGRHEEAGEILERLTKIRPESVTNWIYYGKNLRSSGDVPGAVAAYRKAIDLDFECGEAWWSLAGIKRDVIADGDVDAMRRALDIAIDIRNIAPLNFALARALHDRGDYEGAFRHYSEANRLRAEPINYDADELTGEVAEYERMVDPAFIAASACEPLGDDVPIFIISLPRSGSTLLEQILSGHAEIEAIGELPYIPAILRTAMELATRHGRITVPQLTASISDNDAAAMGRDYLKRAAVHRTTDKRYFIDKLPHNWSNVLFVRRILPQAKFIDIRRPAMDCCFSNFTQSFSAAHASSFGLASIGRSYVDYVRLMDHLDRVAPGLIHHVDYGALLDDPERQIKGALDYLGMDWDANLLNFHKSDRVVRTPSSEQVRRPLNRDGVGVWKPYSQWLDPLREALGPLAN